MVFDRIRSLIARQLDKDEKSITEDSRLLEDLGADSANIMVMILDLETEFGIEVEDDVIMSLKTVGDVVKYVESRQ